MRLPSNRTWYILAFVSFALAVGLLALVVNSSDSPEPTDDYTAGIRFKAPTSDIPELRKRTNIAAERLLSHSEIRPHDVRSALMGLVVEPTPAGEDCARYSPREHRIQYRYPFAVGHEIAHAVLARTIGGGANHHHMLMRELGIRVGGPLAHCKRLP